MYTGQESAGRQADSMRQMRLCMGMKQHTAQSQNSSGDELAGPLWYGVAGVSWSEQS